MRSQISSQVYIYVAAMIIVALVGVVGFKLTQSVTKSTTKSEFSKFETTLRNDVDELSEQIGSYRIREFEIPNEYDEICFVDLEDVDYNEIFNHPLIKNSVENEVDKNVFFISGESMESIYIEKLAFPDFPEYACTTSEKFNLEIRGIEGKGAVIPPPERFICEQAEIWGCSNSFSNYYTDCDYENLCCELHELCCEVEI